MSITKTFLWIILSFFLFAELSYSETIYTPEGCPINAMVLSGTPSHTNEWAQYWINYYGLDATIIGDPTRAYNCHGYAWAVTEGIGNYWIQDDEELNFFTDGAYSNDGQPSYITASQSSATHGCYEPYSDHSVRVIQNNYPVSPYVIQGHNQTQVSKWNDGPLVRHGLRGDVYAAWFEEDYGYPVPINFRILKTTHYGTLSSYNKTWIGNMGKTHTITGDVIVPSNVYITITGNVTVSRSSQNYGFKFTPGSSTGLLVKGSMNVTGSADNLFKFISNSATPSRSDWGGIYVEEGGSINLDYCEIADAVAGIQTESVNEFSVRNSIIHHTNYHGILVNIPWGITANITNNCIYDNYRSGIMTVPSDGIANIKYNVIYDNYDHGMFVQLYRAYVYNNTVTNNNDGIWVGGSSSSSIIYIKNNIVSSNNKSGWGSEHYGI